MAGNPYAYRRNGDALPDWPSPDPVTEEYLHGGAHNG